MGVKGGLYEGAFTWSNTSVKKKAGLYAGGGGEAYRQGNTVSNQRICILLLKGFQ